MPNRIWILALEFKFQIRFGTCIVSGTVGGRSFLSDFTSLSSIPVPVLCILFGYLFVVGIHQRNLKKEKILLHSNLISNR